MAEVTVTIYPVEIAGVAIGFAMLVLFNPVAGLHE
jgi:hypothetical protein